MKIVVTDGYTLNGGDLSWDQISSFGDIIIYDRTPMELLIERCKDADIVLTNKVPFTKDSLKQLNHLKLICVLATGYNVIDITAAKELDIEVCNVPAYGTASVAQHVFALLLELTNHVGLNAVSVTQGKWERSSDWCYTEAPISELYGKTFGIVGYGNIGRQTAGIAKAFGMNIIYYSRKESSTDLGEPSGLEELFSNSDVISLHCSLRADNHQFVNLQLLKRMKSSAILINAARGQLINENDLAEVLNQNRIAGAALDVLSEEPPKSGNPLLKAKNCLITPHNAWISKEARGRIINITAANIEAFLNNQPINCNLA
jgi:glycerate dehydrogenase